MLPAFTPVAAVLDIVLGLVMGLFLLSTVIMTFVILLQEGKGGGLAGAFGGAAAETFGVKAGTVNRFTAYVATAFMGLALLYAGLASNRDQPDFKDLPAVEVAPPTAPASASPGDKPAVGPVAPGDEKPVEPPGGDKPVEPPPEKPADAPEKPADAPEKPAEGGDKPAEGDGAGR